MKAFVRLFAIAALLFSCFACADSTSKSDNDSVDSDVTNFLSSLSEAHAAESYLNKGLVQYTLKLKFNEKLRFFGTVSMTPDGSRVRMVDQDKTIIWDGENVYLAGDTTKQSKARFDVLTWSYFFAAPFKVNDPGTKHLYKGIRTLENDAKRTLKLTFENAVGDSPDDWYLLYQDTVSNRLDAMAYIVTYGQSKEEASADPHAIVYEGYREIESIPIPTLWNFWGWNESGELKGHLGKAELFNVHFTSYVEGLFEPPISSILVSKD